MHTGTIAGCKATVITKVGLTCSHNKQTCIGMTFVQLRYNILKLVFGAIVVN